MSAVEQHVGTYDPIAAMGIIRWQEGMNIEPGKLYKDLPDELYHRGPGISKSGLDLIRRSPMHYKFVKANPQPEKEHFHVGKAFHALVLEPERFEKDFIKAEYAEFRTKAAKEWKAIQEADGKTVLRINTGKSDIWNPSEWDLVHRMRDAIMEHPVASVLLQPESGLYELSGYWVDTQKSDERIRTAYGSIPASDIEATYKLCKIRMDFFNFAHNIIADLKTTTDASYTAFSRSIIEYYYEVQDAFYRYGMAQLGCPVDEFVFVSIEKEPPYAVGCYVLDADAKRLGATIFRQDLATYMECKAKDEWPGYRDRDGSIMRSMTLPQYAFHNVRIF